MLIDKLHKAVEEKGNVCLGLDTRLDYIPEHIKEEYPGITDQIFQFNKRIIDETLEEVAIYKLQIACYEAYGLDGLRAYKETMEYLREKGALSMGDIKRGDISSTAEMYGQAHFSGDFETDFITLNPYMGYDSITPYLPYLEDGKKGIFVLLRTSNPGAEDIQYLRVRKEGGQDLEVYYEVGDNLEKLGEDFLGESGYSLVGGVVGGTRSDEAVEIRERYKNMFFLIPGYGAQGGSAEAVADYLRDSNGGIVNSSRGIITAYKNYEDGEENFAKYAKKAVLEMKEDIRLALVNKEEEIDG